MLSDDFHSEVVLENGDTLIATNGTNESLLDLMAGIIGMMKDTEFTVSPLTMEVELPVLIAVEVHAPLHQVGNALRCIAHHLFYGCWIADEIAGNHRVVDMFLEVVHLEVGDTGNAALCLVGIRLVDSGLADERYLALAALSDLQCITHSGHARANNEEVEFANHGLYLIMVYKTSILLPNGLFRKTAT